MPKPPKPPPKLLELHGAVVRLVTPSKDWNGQLELQQSGEYRIFDSATRVYFSEEEVRAVDVARRTIYLKHT
jgi:hypothetical protein